MSKRILLIDGNSIMNRAFYAVIGRDPMMAPDGTPTGALNGFFNTLLSVKDEYKPTDICVLFDLKAPTFRHKMSAEYKAQRKGMPPELSAQMPIVKELLDLAGISRMELEGYEADDLIGTLSRLGEEAGDEVYILSGDHDDFQLISDKVKVIMPQSGKGKPPRVLYTKELFEETYGVDPNVFVHVKALMGDNSDNIKGVEKVGEKTAFKLIAQYGDVDGVYDHADELTPALAQRVKDSRELLDLNLKLCMIDRFVPVPFGIEKTGFDDIADKQGLYDRLYNLSLKQLTKKLGLDGMKTSVTGPAEDEDPRLVELISKTDALVSSLSITGESLPKLSDDAVVAIDFTDDRALVAFQGESKVYSVDPESLYDSFKDTHGIVPVSFDYKEKSKLMSRALPNVESIFDIAIAGYVFNLIDGSKPDHRRLYESLMHQPYPIDEEKEGPKQLDLTAQLFGESQEQKDDKLKVAGHKLILDLAMAQRLRTLIEEGKKGQLLYEIEFPLVVTLDAIERNGMHVSGDKLSTIHEEFSGRLKQLEQKICDETGYEFNIGSPKQLAEVLFDEDKLNLPHGKKGKTGVYSTSIDVLNGLLGLHPVIEDIIEFRALSKLDSTYAVGLKEKIESDGRIRTTFTQAMTNTGRLSSTEPNLQNIPVRSAEGARIRECFTVPEGKMLVDADYSQIELRLLAAMSKDETMTEAFIEGADIHKRTAMKVFGVSEEDVTPKQRAAAKTVNFSIIYGISEYGLSNDLHISYKEAGELIRSYGEQFPGITGYLDGLKAAGEKLGYVETMFGRRRNLTELMSQNVNIRKFGLRAAMNTPVQGTAADIIKIAMNKVYKALQSEVPEAKLVMQVHDELIVECDIGDADKVGEILKREMEGAVKLNVPLVADVHSGSNWLEAK